MIMLTKKESIKAATLFLEFYFDQTTSNEVTQLLNNLRSLSKNDNGTDHKIIWGKYLDIAKNKLMDEDDFPAINPNADQQIPEGQAFEAMHALLVDIYTQTNSSDIGAFLGSLLHGYYGATSDPAAWYNWERFLQKVISERQTTDENSAN